MVKLKWEAGETEYYFVTRCKTYHMAVIYINGVAIYEIWKGYNTRLGHFATPDEAANYAEENANDVPQ